MHHQFPGRLIVVEGPDLAGKTDQRDLIQKYLLAAGLEVVMTREPGGTPFAEEIRELCKRPIEETKHPMTELLLNYAAREQHMKEVIIPALKRGAVVLADRFHFSSYVYQGEAGGLGWHAVNEINKLVLDGFHADHTFIFKVSLETADARKIARAEKYGQVADHFDDKDRAYQERIQRGYARILRGILGRTVGEIIEIDAEPNHDQVFAQVMPYLMRIVNDMKKRPVTAQYPKDPTYRPSNHPPQPALVGSLAAGFVVSLPGATLVAESPTELYRISVVCQNAPTKHLVDVDDYDRLWLDAIAYGSWPASRLERKVERVIEIINDWGMKKRDGITAIHVQKFPFDESCQVHVVQVEEVKEDDKLILGNEMKSSLCEVNLPGATIYAANWEELYHIDVVYQDGRRQHVVSIDDEDRVLLAESGYGTWHAKELRGMVSDVIRCLDMRQRDGIKELHVREFPFTDTSRIHVVSTERTLSI